MRFLSRSLFAHLIPTYKLGSFCQDKVAEPINQRLIPRVNHRSGIKFLYDGWTFQHSPGGEAVAVIDWTFDVTFAFGKIHGADNLLRG